MAPAPTPRRSTRLARRRARSARRRHDVLERRRARADAALAAAPASGERSLLDGAGSEHLERHTVVVGHLPPPDLDPDVVAAAGRDDGEMLAWQLRHLRQLVLHGAELFERALGFERQQLVHDPAHGVDGQPAWRGRPARSAPRRRASRRRAGRAPPHPGARWREGGTGRSSWPADSLQRQCCHGSPRPLSSDGTAAHGTVSADSAQ